MSNELYEKVEKICTKIDSYTNKEISVKNEVKTKLYISKINKLINLIENAENNPDTPKINIQEEVIAEEVPDNKYNPYSEEFCYKERLDKLGGDINKLIEKLKVEDKKGYRNAYIINEIQNYVKNAKTNESNNKLDIKNKLTLWERIKSIFKF